MNCIDSENSENDGSKSLDVQVQISPNNFNGKLLGNVLAVDTFSVIISRTGRVKLLDAWRGGRCLEMIGLPLRCMILNGKENLDKKELEEQAEFRH